MLRTNVKIKFKVLMILALQLLSTAACGVKPKSKSSVDAVEIAQTDVRNQFRAGFCWSYAVMGLIESKYKMDTGENVDLSEEAIAFYRMAEELTRMGQQVRSGQVSKADAVATVVDRQKLEGWYVRSSLSSNDGMELVDIYGAVPEDNWSFKFKTAAQMQSVRAAIAVGYKALLDSNSPITVSAVADAMTVAGAFPSKPPTTIRFKGQAMLATDFAKNVLKFKSADYAVVASSNAADSRKVLATAKRAMARGLSVPLSFVFDFSHLENGVLRTSDYSIEEWTRSPGLVNGIFSESSGGHAVLLTDFVNVGGREGAMSSSALKSEVLKGVEDLEYLKFKNSWGLNARENESGVPVTAGSEGYYYLENSYFKAAAAYGHLSVVVPRDIAAAPNGEVIVNAKVTTDQH